MYTPPEYKITWRSPRRCKCRLRVSASSTRSMCTWAKLWFVASRIYFFFHLKPQTRLVLFHVYGASFVDAHKFKTFWRVLFTLCRINYRHFPKFHLLRGSDHFPYYKAPLYVTLYLLIYFYLQRATQWIVICDWDASRFLLYLIYYVEPEGIILHFVAIFFY